MGKFSTLAKDLVEDSITDILPLDSDDTELDETKLMASECTPAIYKKLIAKRRAKNK